MPYSITTKDGITINNIPDDVAADSDMLRDRVAKIRAGGNTTPARKASPPQETYDPTEGMSWGEKAMAGVGKAVVDTGRGLAQLTPWGMSREEYDQIKQRDAALMDTGGGLTGNILGQIGMALAPGGAIGKVGQGALALTRNAPKAAQVAQGMVSAGSRLNAPQTVMGAAGVGAGQGAVQPVGTTDSRFGNAVQGSVGGAAIPAAVGAGRTAYNVLAPLTQKGSERVAARTIERFATDPSRLRNVQAEQYVPGSMPTLADVTADPGLATLQLSLRNNPDIKGALVAREQANNAARSGALRDIAGDKAKRSGFVESRQYVAKDLYNKAFDEAPELTPWIKGRVTNLRSRPVFNEALAGAERQASNEGVKLNPDNIVQVLHYAKMELDGMASEATRTGSRNLKGIEDTQRALVSMMESKDFAPAYRAARTNYAEMSRPINQMDIGQELLNKLQPAMAEAGASLRENKSAFAQAMRNADDTAARALDFPGAKMENIMEPEQMRAIQGVLKDIGRAANTQDMGKALGSPTTQNFLSQDILRQSLGPLGIPQSFLESQFANNALRPMSWIYKQPEQKAMNVMGDAMLNPDEWKRLLLLLDQQPGLLQQFTNAALPRSVVPAAIGATNVD